MSLLKSPVLNINHLSPPSTVFSGVFGNTDLLGGLINFLQTESFRHRELSRNNIAVPVVGKISATVSEKHSALSAEAAMSSIDTMPSSINSADVFISISI